MQESICTHTHNMHCCFSSCYVLYIAAWETMVLMVTIFHHQHQIVLLFLKLLCTNMEESIIIVCMYSMADLWCMYGLNTQPLTIGAVLLCVPLILYFINHRGPTAMLPMTYTLHLHTYITAMYVHVHQNHSLGWCLLLHQWALPAAGRSCHEQQLHSAVECTQAHPCNTNSMKFIVRFTIKKAAHTNNYIVNYM